MGFLGFCFLALWMLKILAAQPRTEPLEVDAVNKIIDHWNLRSKLNISSVDPCIQNASWAPDTANPRIACDCSDTLCHITHLKIYALDISGEIPPELFLLTELTDLDLNQNVLNGSLPPAIGQLSKMEYLAVGINNLTGPVPVELGNLTKLLSLSFSSNNFHGPLPASLGNLTSLEQLYIDSSGVTGPIPQELSNLKSLQILWASDNGFTGKIPDLLGTFAHLTVLRLEGTSLDGPIPKSFGALTSLDDLRIGDIGPSNSSLDFLENLSSLSILSLRNCRVTGKIPVYLSTFKNLKILDLSFNKLTGQIPASFKKISSLQYLYLGSNNLNGEFSSDFLSSSLLALDVSFNPLTGNVPLDRKDISINVVGTSINNVNLKNEKASAMLHCLESNTKCKTDPFSSFSINSGGTEYVSADGNKFDDDDKVLGAASSYTSANNRWAVSSSGIYISNPRGPSYIAQTDSQVSSTLDSELYKTARIAPISLRYYGLGLENGVYRVELHFAEIQMDMDDSTTWRSLGRRLFDVYVQGERVLQDFNIVAEAKGSKRGVVKTIEANVSNTVMDIHLLWSGKGTCCIPLQSTYGPLVSGIHVSKVSGIMGSSSSNKKTTPGRVMGIAIGCAAGVVIVCCGAYYLWRAKKGRGRGHIKVYTDSPARNRH